MKTMFHLGLTELIAMQTQMFDSTGTIATDAGMSSVAHYFTG